VASVRISSSNGSFHSVFLVGSGNVSGSAAVIEPRIGSRSVVHRFIVVLRAWVHFISDEKPYAVADFSAVFESVVVPVVRIPAAVTVGSLTLESPVKAVVAAHGSAGGLEHFRIKRTVLRSKFGVERINRSPCHDINRAAECAGTEHGGCRPLHHFYGLHVIQRESLRNCAAVKRHLVGKPVHKHCYTASVIAKSAYFRIGTAESVGFSDENSRQHTEPVRNGRIARLFYKIAFDFFRHPCLGRSCGGSYNASVERQKFSGRTRTISFFISVIPGYGVKSRSGELRVSGRREQMRQKQSR